MCIASQKDIDIKIPLEEQQSQIPYKELTFYRYCFFENLFPPCEIEKPIKQIEDRKVQNQCHIKTRNPKKTVCDICAIQTIKELSEECFLEIHTTMENLIYDCLHSKMFENLLERSKNEIPPLYYGHFKHYDQDTRKHLVQNIVNAPPKWLLSYIIEEMLQDAVIHMFNVKQSRICMRSSTNLDTSIIQSSSSTSNDIGTSDKSQIGRRKDLIEQNYTDLFLFLLDYL